MTGTAKSAPTMPYRVAPAATASTTASGWTETALPMMNGWSTLPSSCWTASTTSVMMIAATRPLETSATMTAMMPVTTAPTIGTKEPRKTSTVSGKTSGMPMKKAPMPMPIASTPATITCTRTYCTSDCQPRRPAPSARPRARRGSIPMNQEKILRPS